MTKQAKQALPAYTPQRVTGDYDATDPWYAGQILPPMLGIPPLSKPPTFATEPDDKTVFTDTDAERLTR